MSELFEKEFVSAYTNKSDMHEHVKYLKSLCDDEDVNHVTEMGTRTGVSTRAWLNSDVTLRACDLKFDPRIKQLMDIAVEEGKDVSYYEGNCLHVLCGFAKYTKMLCKLCPLQQSIGISKLLSVVAFTT